MMDSHETPLTVTTTSTTDPSLALCDEKISLVVYHWINFVVITIIAIIGLLSQVTVIAVLTSIKKKTSTDVFLLALSVLDILVIITLSATENGSIYAHILRPGQQVINAGYISLIAHPFEHMLHFASTWCICLMSFDRYLSVCHPVKALSWCTVHKARLQLVILSVCAVLYTTPRFLEYYSAISDLETRIGLCDAEVHSFPKDSLGENSVYVWGYTFISYFLLMYVIPLILLCFTNSHLIRIIRKRLNYQKKRANHNAGVGVTRCLKDPAHYKRNKFSSLCRWLGQPANQVAPQQVCVSESNHPNLQTVNDRSCHNTVRTDVECEISVMSVNCAKDPQSIDSGVEKECPGLSEELSDTAQPSKGPMDEGCETVQSVVKKSSPYLGGSQQIDDNTIQQPEPMMAASDEQDSAVSTDPTSSTSQPAEGTGLSESSKDSLNKGLTDSKSHDKPRKVLKSTTIEEISDRDKFIRRQYDQVIRMLITVTIVFSVCQIPDMIEQLISRMYTDWQFSDELGIIAYDFVIVNSSINLFIYTVTSQRFKRRLIQTLRMRCWRRDKVMPLEGNTTHELS